MMNPLQGDGRPLEDWVTTFHLVTVVLDPYTYESSWIIDTAGRILENFAGADVRVAWVVAADEEQTAEFLGPWGDQLLAFADPDRDYIKALGLEYLPALVHLDHSLNVVGAAESWDPQTWSPIIDGLATMMSWSRPLIPDIGDPAPYEGTAALGR